MQAKFLQAPSVFGRCPSDVAAPGIDASARSNRELLSHDMCNVAILSEASLVEEWPEYLERRASEGHQNSSMFFYKLFCSVMPSMLKLSFGIIAFPLMQCIK